MADKSKANVILCSAWVPKGRAKADPEKVEVSGPELKELLEKTQNNLGSMKMDDSEEEWEDEKDSDAESLDGEKENEQEKESKLKQEEMDVDEEEEEEDINKLYNMEEYEDEPESNLGGIAELRGLVVYPDNKDDPYLEVPKERDDDDISEAENHAILPDDNLIAVGHFEGENPILEVYVYNHSTNSLYVHHDNLLREAPLCMEWLSYKPRENAGNLVAVGVMGPLIQAWDLDLIDGMAPAYELNCEVVPRVKKYMKKLAKQQRKGVYKDEEFGVLSLAWNKTYEHILASGDNHGVILWDLSRVNVPKEENFEDSELQDSKLEEDEPKDVELDDSKLDDSLWTSISGFGGRVQSLAWNPEDPSILLAGASGVKFSGKVHMIDCNQEGKEFDITKGMTWEVKGDVEKVQWQKVQERDGKEKLYILATTGIVQHKKRNIKQGYIYCFDPTLQEPLWCYEPHDSACSNIVISHLCPGLMITGADDGTVRVWDTLSADEKKPILSEPPKIVEELNPQVGQVFTLTASPEEPFVFAMGGDNRCNNFRLWDITTSQNVRRVFCPRLGLSVDENKGNAVKLEPLPEVKEEKDELFTMLTSSKKSKNPIVGQAAEPTEKKKNKKNKVKRLNNE